MRQIANHNYAWADYLEAKAEGRTAYGRPEWLPDPSAHLSHYEEIRPSFISWEIIGGQLFGYAVPYETLDARNAFLMNIYGVPNFGVSISPFYQAYCQVGAFVQKSGGRFIHTPPGLQDNQRAIKYVASKISNDNVETIFSHADFLKLMLRLSGKISFDMTSVSRVYCYNICGNLTVADHQALLDFFDCPVYICFHRPTHGAISMTDGAIIPSDHFCGAPHNGVTVSVSRGFLIAQTPFLQDVQILTSTGSRRLDAQPFTTFAKGSIDQNGIYISERGQAQSVTVEPQAASKLQEPSPKA